ncbi:MAG: hypothetical protein ACEY3A_04890 [Wolbachia sp.]
MKPGKPPVMRTRNTFPTEEQSADDLALITKTKDELQISIYRLSEIRQDYGMRIWIKKTKIMAFIGKDSVRSKIVIRKEMLEQVIYTFIYTVIYRLFTQKC